MLEANNVPYGMSPGNHDQYPSGVANFYDQFFPPSRFLENSWYGGYLGAEAGETNRLNKDNYELFSVGRLRLPGHPHRDRLAGVCRHVGLTRSSSGTRTAG